MRKLVAVVMSALAVAAVVALPASASSRTPATAASSRTLATAGSSSRLSMTAKITRFRATAAGVVADGTLSGKLNSGSGVARDSAPVSFAAVAKASGGRCNVVTLRLAPLDLELLGVQVTTSYISLDVYAEQGRVLGDLFCGLAHAKVTFPKGAMLAHDLNKRLGGKPLTLFTTSESAVARSAQASTQTCQVLKLVLGPLHLDLLGLVVDLYGKTTANPVVVTINAMPNNGLLGQLLCGVAGGGGITSLAGLQNLLSSLGVNLSTTQLQNVLNQLGIGSLAGGLTQTQLNSILGALGLGSTL